MRLGGDPTADGGRFRNEEQDAGRIATLAGDKLLEVRRSGPGGGSTLAAAGDRIANDLIIESLKQAYPTDAMLSEESADDGRRLTSKRVWIIDPLDGSREYGEPERKDWAVHVAFLYDGALAAGAVALPALGMTMSTGSAPEPDAIAKTPPRIAVSRTRPPEVAAHVAAALGAELLQMGSAGFKAMAVVLGDAEAYLHAGGQHEWDVAAPAAVALAAGLHVSRIDGSSLRFNQPDAWLPDLLICRQELAAPILTAVQSFTPS